MASIEVRDPGARPGTHALVVGVSHYPFADGDQATDLGASFGLQDLTSAARSASEFAAWLRSEYHNPAAPLASLHVLLSPSEGEALHPDILARLPGDFGATRAAVEHDLGVFREKCRDPANVGIVYVAGHGVQLTKRGAIVLLEDFAAPHHLNQMGGAIDMASCHAGLNGSEFAGKQFWFVDACRQRPAVARRFEDLEGALRISEPRGHVESSPLFLASSSREEAFAEVGGVSLFNRAVLGLLRGGGARGPGDGCASWHVSVSSLVERLDPDVKSLARAHSQDQHVDITGRVNEALIQRFQGEPDVRLHVSIVPEAAALKARGSLLFDGEKPVLPDAATWPITGTVPAGLYVLSVQADAPFRSVIKPLNVRPLSFRDQVKVD